eukprot:SAG11_NODE_1520_length_4755_cov_14.225515_1_plen_166_part_00
MATPVDTLIHAAYVLPIEGSDTALKNHSVAVHEGKIIAVLPTAEAAEAYTATEVVDLPGVLAAFHSVFKPVCAICFTRNSAECHPRLARTRPGHCLMPGLVNAHTHAPMTILRGYADDMGLMEWLMTKIFPGTVMLMSVSLACPPPHMRAAQPSCKNRRVRSEMF